MPLSTQAIIAGFKLRIGNARKFRITAFNLSENRGLIAENQLRNFGTS